jgi:hypothetical protein
MDQAKAAIEALRERTSTRKHSLHTPLKRLEKRLHLDRLHPYEIVIASLAVGSVSSVLCLRLYARYWKRFPTSAHVPESYLKQRRWIKGYVTKCVSLTSNDFGEPCAYERHNEV